jgi:hypothetical protein
MGTDTPTIAQNEIRYNFDSEVLKNGNFLSFLPAVQIYFKLSTFVSFRLGLFSILTLSLTNSNRKKWRMVISRRSFLIL